MDGAQHNWILNPWNQITWPDPYPTLYFILALVIATILFYYLQKWWLQKRAKQEEWERVDRLCKRCHLGSSEQKALIEALLHCPLGYPGLALVSRSYFDRFLARPLAERLGIAATEILRDKLFSELHESFVGECLAYPDTHSIRNGESIRLHFKSAAGDIHGLVVENGTDSLSVVFPYNKERALVVSTGDRVEGVFEDNGALIGFETNVHDVRSGQLLVCELRHTETIGEMKHRESVRVHLDQIVHFRHHPRRMSKIEERETSLEGLISEMTLGGCLMRAENDRQWEPGDRVSFDLRLKKKHLFHLTGEVVSVLQGSHGHKTLDLRFLNVDDATRHALSIALYALRPRGRPRGKDDS